MAGIRIYDSARLRGLHRENVRITAIALLATAFVVAIAIWLRSVSAAG